MKLLTTIITIASSINVVMSQYMPINTQYMYHSLLVNPAITGSKNALITSFSYRNQWLGSDLGPKTMLLSGHTPLKNDKIALGVQLYKDEVNPITKTGVSTYFSYKIVKENKQLNFGTKLGVYSTKNKDVNLISKGDLVFNEDFQLAFGTGFGMYYKTNTYYLGAALPEIINGPNSTIDAGTWNYTLIAGYDCKVSKDLSVLPNILFRKIEAGNMQPDITLIFRLKKTLDIGILSRLSKTYGLSLDYLIAPQLQIGYSFDYGLGGLNPENSAGNHEINISYELKKIVHSTNTKFF